MNLSDVSNRRLCLRQPVPACGLTHGCVTMLSDSQGCELFTSFSFYSRVTIDGNPAVIMHATVDAFRAAINLKSMLFLL